MRTAAIVPAAGRGVRLGVGTPKVLRPLGGAPLLVHAVRTLGGSPVVDLVVVAAPPPEVSEVTSLLAEYALEADVLVVPGGETRQHSVGAAFATLPIDVDVVLVHDAARPLVPSDLVARVAAAVRDGAAAVIPVLPVTDTLKEVEPAGTAERVVRTVERGAIRAVQTPQGFRRAVLARAYAAADGHPGQVTDDAGLVERLGVEVLTVDGAEEAFKVTRPLDLVLAEAVLARRRGAS